MRKPASWLWVVVLLVLGCGAWSLAAALQAGTGNLDVSGTGLSRVLDALSGSGPATFDSQQGDFAMVKWGYDDTPLIPGQKWKVHDSSRPQPTVVKPGEPPTLGAQPPSDGVVLFGGKDLSNWKSGDGGPAKWKVKDGCAEVVPEAGRIVSKKQFGDCQLHLEWAAPTPPTGHSQERGNSGVFLMGRYEVQVLDCWKNRTYADGMTASLYGQYPPLVNACRRPGEWQTYDIIWIAPRFEGGKLKSPARITVFHNGILVHHDREVLGGTRHKEPPVYSPHPPRGPLALQDHGDPVRYRNIWYRPLKPAEEM